MEEEQQTAWLYWGELGDVFLYLWSMVPKMQHPLETCNSWWNVKENWPRGWICWPLLILFNCTFFLYKNNFLMIFSNAFLLLPIFSSYKGYCMLTLITTDTRKLILPWYIHTDSLQHFQASLWRNWERFLKLVSKPYWIWKVLLASSKTRKQIV